ncbi:MAG: TIGR03862 family flavoprotein [Ahniella sp.]|nr:TIGR03862 family flavoprotein [Ahniella sp.]
MAAMIAAKAGVSVEVFERKASVGRKFLIAGRGGLNLTHADPRELFRSRYGAEAPFVGPWLVRFDGDDAREFAAELGIETFVGSSGRVFPKDMKAAPMLRHWVQRLREMGVRFHVRHELRQLARTDQGSVSLEFDHEGETVHHETKAVILALGGASWPQLGSDGSFVSWLSALAPITPWQSANCGFDVPWSPAFRTRMAGTPLKPIRLSLAEAGGDSSLQGECVVCDYGLEGSLVYTLSRPIREQINRNGYATLVFDLVPSLSADRLESLWGRQDTKRSVAERLRRVPGLDAAKIDLVFECIKNFGVPAASLPGALKALPVRLERARPIAEAISSAGGVAAEGLDDGLMLKSFPGLFCAGEMLDWEAPTGGYLLTASMASGVVAAEAACDYLGRPV